LADCEFIGAADHMSRHGEILLGQPIQSSRHCAVLKGMPDFSDRRQCVRCRRVLRGIRHLAGDPGRADPGSGRISGKAELPSLN
jgi:hypothetical protein